jgi:hypothetical protein
MALDYEDITMGKYYSKYGLLKEIAIVIGMVLLVATASATIYFGAIAPHEPAPSTVTVEKSNETHEPVTPIVYEPYIESPELQKYRAGGHDMGEDFSWRRDDVSGSKDLLMHASVYGYRIEPTYQWWSVSWGQYFTQVPNEGMKYLFVYVKIWMEGNSTNWDPRIYGFDTSHFLVQIDNHLYQADPEYVPPIRIKELEEVWNKGNVSRIGPFGCLRINDHGLESCIGGQWVRMGDENGLDGFIVYQVPEKTRPEDISVLGQFRGFGSAWWSLE